MTKKATSGKSVVKSNKDEIALLEQMNGYGQTGFEDTSSDSFAIPFIRILQANSPQLLEDDDSYIEKAKPGMFFNTLTGDLYGKTLSVINIHFTRDFIEWRPNRGGFVMSHGDDESIRRRVVEVEDNGNQVLDNGNILQESRNHFLLLPDHMEDGPMIFALTSTGIRHSKRWMSMMRRIKNPQGKVNNPIFMGVWEITTALNENEEGKWYQIGTRSAGKYEFDRIINAEEFEVVKMARDLILSGRAKVDYESGMEGGKAEGSEDDVPF